MNILASQAGFKTSIVSFSLSLDGLDFAKRTTYPLYLCINSVHVLIGGKANLTGFADSD